MNTQERDVLTVFLTQLTQAQVGPKDTEADTLITQALAKQPSAGYLLVQRAMQLDFVLQQTQAKVAELQAQLARQQPAAQTSFLGDVHAWGRAPTSATQSAPAPVGAAAPRPAAVGGPVAASAAPAAAAAAAPAAAAPWGSSVMGTVATTAAGVVAGSFLYSGIQSLMGHHNPSGAFGSGAGSNNPQPSSYTENTTVVNNYYSNEPASATHQEAPEASNRYDVADASDDYSSSDFGGSDDTA